MECWSRVLDVTLDCFRYLPVAQNGFVNLPSQLNIDSGYYGSGFYFTRYPRCGRCFIMVRESV